MAKSIENHDEPVMGRADVLLRFLQLIGKDTPKEIDAYLDGVDGIAKDQPIVDQIADKIIGSDKELYKMYIQARQEVGARNPYSSVGVVKNNSSEVQLLGEFILNWSNLEDVLRKAGKRNGLDSRLTFPSRQNLQGISWISDAVKGEMDYVRHLRNNVVHSVNPPSEEQLIDAISIIKRVINELSSQDPDSGSGPTSSNVVEK